MRDSSTPSSAPPRSTNSFVSPDSDSTPAKNRLQESSLSSLSSSASEDTWNARWWFENRVYVSTSSTAIEDLLAQVGGATVLGKFRGRLASWNDPEDQARTASLKGYELEASNPTESGLFWFETLSNTVVSFFFQVLMGDSADLRLPTLLGCQR